MTGGKRNLWRIVGLFITLLACGLLLTSSVPREPAGEPVQVLGRGLVYRAAWSPDGETLALASSRGLWLCSADLAICRLLFDGHALVSVVYTGDGAYLITGTADGEVIIWDIQSGDVANVQHWPTGRVRGVAFSPDNTRLAAGDESGTVYVWDFPALENQMVLRAHTGAVTAVAFSPDGGTLASSSKDGTVQMWDVVTGETEQTLTGDAWGLEINDLAWKPDGSQIAGVDVYGNVLLWSPDGTLLVTWNGIELDDAPRYALQWHELFGVDWSQDGRWLAAASNDGKVWLWDATRGELQQTLQPDPFSKPVFDARFRPGSDDLALAAWNGQVSIWRIGDQYPLAILENPASQVIRLDVGSDGEALAVGSRDGWISLWKLGETTPWFMQRAHAGSVTTLQFSPDGHWLISASEADTLRVWDVKHGTLVHSLPITRGVDSAAFSADGNQLYVVVERPSKAAPYRSVLTRWRFDARSGLQPDDGWSEFEAMSILASSPDGSLLLGNVALYNAYHSSLWNPDESQMVGDLVESPDARSYVFSPDGHWLAVAVGKQGVHLRDTQDTFWNGPILAGHRAGVGAVAFTPDGQVLASGDWSGNIQLLRVTGGRRLLRELRGHQDTVRGLAFTPDGRKLISGGDDNTIRVWDLAGIVPTSGRRPTPVAPVLPVSPEQAWRVTTPMSAWGFRRLYPHLDWGVHVADAYGDTLIAAGGGMYHHRLDADEREWGEIESRAWITPWALAMVSEDEFWAAGMSGKLRHFRGSMWEEVTGPTQDHLWDIEMLAPDDGWIVGENGAVWRYQGAEWLTVATPTTDTLYALDFVSRDEAWAAGRDGTLLHFESGAWQRVPSPTTQHLRGLDMVSRDLGWAVGAGGTILRFDGQKWLSVQSPITDNLHCVSAPAPGVAWAVGMDGAMVYFDGDEWNAGQRLTHGDMWSVLMLSPDEGWTFSGESLHDVVLHYVDGEWRRVSTPMPALYAADAAGNAGWAVGDAYLFGREEPMAMQYIDGDWRVSPGVDAGVDVKALDMVSEDEAWAVGGNRIYHWSLDSSEVMTVPCRLADIEVLSADAGWTVGHGCAFRYQAGIWHSVPISKEWHFGVLGLVSEDDGWASGWVHRDPRLFRLQAGTWTALDIPSEEAFGVIVMVSADEGWAGGGTLSEGQLYHFQGGQWQRESIPRTHCEFVDIEMLSSTEGWALTDCGEVYHYEDEQWRLVAQLDNRVQDLIRLQNGELWVLGDYGAFWFRGP